MTPAKDRPNPFIGPRAFTAEDRSYFFGRKREAQALVRALTVERIVLLHAPSGAGKTSLIHAAVIPQLEQRGFLVLPTIRVTHPELAGTIDHTASTLLHLEAGRPRDDRLGPEQLVGLDLDEYLRRHWEAEGEPRIVLVFDQFEEILTRDAGDEEARRSFFNHLGAALSDRRRWALFSMREEFVAGLHPYLKAIPTHLNATFQLPLLDERAAFEAVTEPALVMGVPFENGAGQHLVDNLCTVERVRPDGTSVKVRLDTVEPLHLQVTCHQLWERWAELDEDTISRRAVDEFADVDHALERYYADKVHAAAAASNVSERTLRDWIEEHLVDRHGIRLQVRKGAESLRTIGDEAVGRLKDDYIIREESARGSGWYELAHDRLVEPIRVDNHAWREEHLQPFQRHADRWSSSRRPVGLLLTGEDLAAAEAWLASHHDELTPLEAEYLELSRDRAKLHAFEEEKRRRAERNRLAWFVRIALVVAVALAVVSYRIAEMGAQDRLEAQVAYDDGRALARAGDDGAILEFERARLLDPTLLDDPHALAALFHGTALVEAGAFDEGAAKLEEAVALDAALAVSVTLAMLQGADRLAQDGAPSARDAFARVADLATTFLPGGHYSLFEQICRVGRDRGHDAAVDKACARAQALEGRDLPPR